MSETLFEFLNVKISITGIYATASVAVLILFMSLWLFGRKKKTGRPLFAGQVMNGIGFGLLPALAVLKALQEMSTGNGSEVFEPLPLIPWLTEGGFFRPGRIETAAAAVGFILLCLWLIMRKDEMPDNGDLLMISVCLWAAIRLVSEDFRRQPQLFFHVTSCAAILACLILWSVRRAKMIHAMTRMIVDLLAVCACIAVNIVTATHLLTTGSEIGDFSVKVGSAFLALMLTMMAGSDLRRIIRRIPETDDSQKTMSIPTVHG